MPTLVQTAVIPLVLAGRDVLACAQTGTGKTAAFALPLLQRLAAARDDAGARSGGGIRVLIVTPDARARGADRRVTRRCTERTWPYAMPSSFGWVSQRPQETALLHDPEVLVATPGRLLDLMRQRVVRLDQVTHLVLDEADRMLDMGFVRDVRAICAAIPAARETLLFSATMPPEVAGLANALLRNPMKV